MLIRWKWSSLKIVKQLSEKCNLSSNRTKGGSGWQKAIDITGACTLSWRVRSDIVFSQSVSGEYSTNRAIWLVPRVDSILPSGPLTAGGIQSVACWVALCAKQLPTLSILSTTNFSVYSREDLAVIAALKYSGVWKQIKIKMLFTAGRSELYTLHQLTVMSEKREILETSFPSK